MINIKSNKGITITTLVIAIIIMLILTGTIVSNISTSDGADRYNNMKADIILIKDKALLYYNKYNEAPVTEKTIEVSGVTYHEVDLQKLGDITLNYGSEYNKGENLTTSSDVYVIDNNLNVYYLKGIKMSGDIYHEIWNLLNLNITFVFNE